MPIPRTPVIDATTGKPKELRCMDCGKIIDQLRQAPSGSMLPRCDECNSNRWKQYSKSETEQEGFGYNPDSEWGGEEQLHPSEW